MDTIKNWGKRRRNPTSLAAKVLANIKDNPAVYLLKSQ
jgi:DNA-binding transcriptional regulator YiaG